MIPSDKCPSENVRAHLVRAGFDVQASLFHGLWYMVAKAGTETYAVSGQNRASVARTLLAACNHRIPSRPAEFAR